MDVELVVRLFAETVNRLRVERDKREELEPDDG